MPSRLDDLRRHRALLEEHLNWLDREIEAAARGGPPAEPAPLPAPEIAPVRPPTRPFVMPATPRPPIPAAADVERLFEQFRAEEQKQGAPPSKAGCWTVFSLILLVLVGAVGALVYFLYR